MNARMPDAPGEPLRDTGGMLVQRAPSSTRQRVRVLVVDDNTGFRDSLVSLLDTDELMVVGQAGNGAQALELIAIVKPDVVLMDVRMPMMDGIETTRRLKALDPNLGSWRSPGSRISARCATCSSPEPRATCSKTLTATRSCTPSARRRPAAASSRRS